MRDVTAQFVTNMEDNARTIGARITFRDPRLRFSEHSQSASDNIGAFSRLYQDSVTLGTAILRVVVVQVASDTFEIYHMHVPDPSLASWPAWVATGINVKAFSGIGLSDDTGRLFYQDTAGDVQFRDWTGTTWTAPTFVFTPSSTAPMNFAPMTLGTFYYIHQNAEPPEEDDDATIGYAELHRYQISSPVDFDQAWRGRIYTEQLYGNSFDAVFHPETGEYVFFADRKANRTKYMLRAAGSNSNSWADVRDLVPMDVVDDTSLFRFSAATVLNSRIFVTGILHRANFGGMHIYTMGPDHWSLGRDMFIAKKDALDQIIVTSTGTHRFPTSEGKFHLIGEKLYYVGISSIYEADATILVGVDNATYRHEVTGLMNLRFMAEANRSARMIGDFPHSVAHQAIRTGSEITVEYAYNNEFMQLGKFGIDAVPRLENQVGQIASFHGRSVATRSIAQWVSDASYDYWSQAKQAGSPADLTTVIRTAGKWTQDENDSDILILDSLNVDGILYATAKASRNALCRGKFKYNTSTKVNPRFGVIVNYRRETREEAVLRLGEDTVSPSEYNHNGIAAIYGKTEHSGGEGIAIYHINDGVYNLLSSTSHTIPGDTVVWIQCQFSDGFIRVTYRQDSSTIWSDVLTHTYESTVIKPWSKEEEGRGAIFVRNQTPSSLCCFFGSKATLIPVQDHSGFPVQDTVIVDNECIDYHGKSPNFYEAGLVYVAHIPGLVNQPVNNASVRINEFDTSVVARQVITNNTTSDWNVTGADVMINKVGDPVYDVKVMIGVPPYVPGEPEGVELGAGIIALSDVPVDPTASLTNVKFSKSVKIESGQSFSLVIRKQYNAHLSSPTNYFNVFYDNTSPIGGNMDTYNDDTDKWENVSGDMVFNIYGTSGEDGTSCLLVQGTVAPDDEFKYNGEVLCVVSGPGLNKFYEIVRHDHDFDGSNRAFYVKGEPEGDIDEGTIFDLTPTLSVSLRGADDTKATAHGSVLVSVKADVPGIETSDFHYFTYERDMRLVDMVAEIAGKAGDIQVIDKRDLDGNITVFNSGFDLPGASVRNVDKRAAIGLVRPNNSIWGTNEIGFAFYMDASFNGRAVTATSTKLRLYSTNPMTVLEEIDILDTPYGYMRLSIQEKNISVWIGDRYMHTFVLPGIPAIGGQNNTGMYPITSFSTVYNVIMSEADTRIDNYILDMGRPGSDLLNELIGEKRFFYMDDQDGNLVLFKSRDTVNTGSPYDGTISKDTTLSEANLSTRVRAEGVEAVEVINNIIEHGNLFRLINLREPNSVEELIELTNAFVNDFSRTGFRRVSGKADPRIQPQDVIELEGENDQIVMTTQFNMVVNQDSAMFDMELETVDNA